MLFLLIEDEENVDIRPPYASLLSPRTTPNPQTSQTGTAPPEGQEHPSPTHGLAPSPRGPPVSGRDLCSWPGELLLLCRLLRGTLPPPWPQA